MSKIYCINIDICRNIKCKALYNNDDNNICCKFVKCTDGLSRFCPLPDECLNETLQLATNTIERDKESCSKCRIMRKHLYELMKEK